MRRFRKNKFFVLVIAVAVLSVVYVVVQKAIDNYNFGTNEDIVTAEESDVSDDEVDSGKEFKTESGGQISGEEVDFVLEEAEESRS